MKLYSLPPSPNSFKVVALAHHLGLELEVVPVDLMSGAHQQPEYLAKNPNGNMPTLEDGDFCLWESNAILIYLAGKKPESGLMPVEPKLQAQVHQWLHWQSNHWNPANRPFVYENMVKPMFHGQPPDPVALEQATPEFHKRASLLEKVLEKADYLVGNQLSVADFALAAGLVYAVPGRLPWDGYPKLREYAARVTRTEAFAKAVPPMPAGAKA